MSSLRTSHTIEQLKPLLSLPGLLLLVITALFYAAYDDTFAELEYYWVEGYNWQFLIPIALAYMLWERRDIFHRLDYRPNPLLGGILLLGSCAILIAGQVSSTHIVRELSIVVSAFAFSVLLLGIEPTRKLFWPLAYLVLMTSIPTEMLERLRTPLKVLSATMAADFLQFLDYAVYREGSFLYLPHITLEVADECSGVNQLTSSIALGIPIAFTILNKWWKRIFIILVSAAFGIIMNWVRVVLISLWHYDSAKESIHGPQDIYGLPFIFMVGVFITLVIAFAIAEKPAPAVEVSDGERPSPLARLFSAPGFSGSAITSILVLAATAIYLHTWPAVPIDLNKPASTFPMSLAGYEGKPLDKLDRPFYSGLADDEVVTRYTSATGRAATVYIGYFRSQNQEKELVDYRFNWLHNGAELVDPPGLPVRMKRKRVKTRDGRAWTVFFSYDINGRNIVDTKRAKLASLLDAVLHKRNNGGIVMVIFDGDKTTLSKDEERFLEAVVKRAWAMFPG